ncbi:MAG: hypothetical protein AB1656_10640 [Candidatus Omnitrophota bacterium]
MNESQPAEEMILSFIGLANEPHVPANILVQTLGNMQRVIHLLAIEHEKKPTRDRDKISGDIERKYSILCSPPEKGSVAIPIRIGDPSCDLFAPDDIRQVASSFRQSLTAISKKNYPDFFNLVKDGNRRNKLIASLDKMIPKRGSGIRMFLKEKNGDPIVASYNIQEAINDFYSMTQEEAATILTVTGRLSEIDFDERKITLVYPPTNRELVCIYDESLEDMLLEHPRDYIQVTGIVVFDEKDNPKKILDVKSIKEVDLSPFVLSDFNYENKSMRLKKNLIFEPRLDESKQLLCIENPDLGIDIFAYTRDDLSKELSDHMEFLWSVYALGDDSKMTPLAQELKRRLLSAIEENEQNAKR